MTDAAGRPLEVIRIPGPGLVPDEDGEPIPASHMNFLIGNQTVVVPTYNDHGEAAVAALRPLFPDRAVVGLPANAILTGGGAFHWHSDQTGTEGEEEEPVGRRGGERGARTLACRGRRGWPGSKGC
jgi:agmatine deiminase